jgi:hypothetical protein
MDHAFDIGAFDQVAFDVDIPPENNYIAFSDGISSYDRYPVNIKASTAADDFEALLLFAAARLMK